MTLLFLHISRQYVVNYIRFTFLYKPIDIELILEYNKFTFDNAGIAQLVEQRIRNAQVACSSHVSSSRKTVSGEAVLFFYKIDSAP